MQDYNFKDFSGVTKLFPLSGVVLFPHSILPLHIFEPRYRQMMNDTLMADKLITIVQPQLPLIQTTTGPALEKIGCIGQVIQHERMDDGRFNLLLAGLKRVRLVDEIRTPGKLYREAEIDILDDIAAHEVSDACRRELSERFIGLVESMSKSELETEYLKQTILSTKDAGLVSDLVSQSLSLPPEIKQALLNDLNVSNRVEKLIQILKAFTTNLEEPDFPPRFSLN